MKKTSLADLANELGVSKTLISLVLNNKGDKHGISKATQEKVIAKANEMNYFPNQMARGLRMGKTNTIGLIVADISNTFYANIARKIEDEVNRLGYNLIICSSDETDKKETELIKILQERHVDGLIISSTLSKADPILELKKKEYPFVLIDRSFPRVKAPMVQVDNFGGARALTRHLIDNGHRKIGFISLSPDYLSTLKSRLMGYKAALKESGIRFNSDFFVEVPFNDIESHIGDELDRLMSKSGGVSAIFTANNNLAIATLKYFKKRRIRIPNDVALATFDDLQLFELSDPPITACAQPRDQIAAESVAMLMDQIKNDGKIKGSTTVELPTLLKIRESSKLNLK